jgi:hypothetical protein
MEKLPFKARLEKDGTLVLPTPSELGPEDAMVWSRCFNTSAWRSEKSEY